jgi:uncharacterized membrane protein
MASVPFSAGADHGEARFFAIMAWLMAATIIAGFSFNIAAGRSSFDAPPVVHAHAIVFMGWTALYVGQNSLILAGNIALHRRLGWLSLVWLPAMIIFGLLIARHAIQARGGPPFIGLNQFLFGNSIMLLAFGGLAGWAIAVRRDTAWHRRLMFCAFAILTGPGFGRLLPMPLLIPYAWWASVFIPMIFPAIGALADWRRHGRVHPAWYWGMGTVAVLQIVSDLIAYSPAGYALTEWFVAGTPGAARPMDPFMPPA